jgi:hypothetical protein
MFHQGILAMAAGWSRGYGFINTGIKMMKIREKIMTGLVAMGLLGAFSAQAGLIFSLDSYDSESGAVAFTVSGTVDEISADYTWSNNRIYIADPGVDWVFTSYGSNPLNSLITPNITPHNTDENSHYYAIEDQSVLTAGEDMLTIQFDNNFSIGEAVNFTWAGSIAPVRADFSQLSANTAVIVGGRIDAVPEPATAGLLGLSSLLLFVIRRIQKEYGLR